MKIKEIHLKTIFEYGEIANINKAIQEFNELIEELRDHKINPDTNTDNIKEEVADCYNMLDKLCVMFGFVEVDILSLKHDKMMRTQRRLEE